MPFDYTLQEIRGRMLEMEEGIKAEHAKVRERELELPRVRAQAEKTIAFFQCRIDELRRVEVILESEPSEP
jgi:hypothetical protein